MIPGDPHLVFAVRVFCVLVVLYAGKALVVSLVSLWKGERK